jgi:hypothetical protein
MESLTIGVFVLVIIAFYAALAFAVVYFAVRLAVRHERAKRPDTPAGHNTTSTLP